jgi:hypothetical protein
MYVPYPYFPSAVAFLTGFDLAQPERVLDGFSRWMSAQHNGSSLSLTSLVLQEHTGREDAGEYYRFREVSHDDQVRVVRHLCSRLRAYRAALDPVRPH